MSSVLKVERLELLTVITLVYPSSLEIESGRWFIYVDLPGGQGRWEIEDVDLPLFDRVPRMKGRKWDGHSASVRSARMREAMMFEYRKMPDPIQNMSLDNLFPSALES